jgi:hypothetical protein
LPETGKVAARAAPECRAPLVAALRIPRDNILDIGGWWCRKKKGGREIEEDDVYSANSLGPPEARLVPRFLPIFSAFYSSSEDISRCSIFRKFAIRLYSLLNSSDLAPEVQFAMQPTRVALFIVPPSTGPNINHVFDSKNPFVEYLEVAEIGDVVLEMSGYHVLYTTWLPICCLDLIWQILIF